MHRRRSLAPWTLLALLPALLLADGPPAPDPFPGGTNPDGSLRPSPPLTELFTQDAYTEYTLLAPGSAQFRIQYLPEETAAGATVLENATRGGSEASDIEVFDPRTGKPLPFTYLPDVNDPATHVIRATLPRPVPEGGSGRVVIWKTYKDPRTYQMHGDDIVWVRSLAGYRLGVVLPPGFALLSSDVAAQLATTPEGRLKLMFANPSGQANPLTLHARGTSAVFAAPAAPTSDMFFDDVKTLYDLDPPESHRIRVEQTYTERRPGAAARLDALESLKLSDVQVIDLDTMDRLSLAPDGGALTAKLAAKLAVALANPRQSAHLRLTGTLEDAGYRIERGELIFDRELRGLRNSVLLPSGWEISSVSQSGTLGIHDGRAFVAFVNLNSETGYRVRVTARPSSSLAVRRF